METDPAAGPPSYVSPPSYEGDPPSYAEAVHDAASADDAGLVQPVILVLNGQAIYAESDPTVHLYEANRGIAGLSAATSVVEFARMEQRPGSAKRRSRHIYNLHHTEPQLSLTRTTAVRHHNTADYFIQAVAAPSRRLGHLGFKYTTTSRELQHHEWSAAALPVDMKGWTERDRPPFVASAVPILEARQRQGVCKWTNGSDGHDIATEYDSEPAHRLLVAASLPRETLDALVALWCCRAWQRSVLEQQRVHAVPTPHSSSIHWKRFR